MRTMGELINKTADFLLRATVPFTLGMVCSDNLLDIKVLVDYYAYLIAGWSSPVARRAHNPKVVGSNPAPATKLLQA